MIDWDKLTKNLERRGFAVRRFSTAQEAADWLNHYPRKVLGWKMPVEVA